VITRVDRPFAFTSLILPREYLQVPEERGGDIKDTGGGMMNDDPGQFHEKDLLGDIWPEAYLDWVEDWTDAYSKERENPLGCCRLEPGEGKVIFPADLTS